MLTFDAARAADSLSRWLGDQLRESNAVGLVVNNSGGVDSATVIGLCARSEVPTLALIQPCGSQAEDAQHAWQVAETFAVPCLLVDLDQVFQEYEQLLGKAFGQLASAGDPGVALANLKPRLRMVSQYYFANRLNYLAVGTGNLSELTIGYFTKFGDGGVDLLPLGNLVKREVYALARFLGVPQVVLEKPPSAGLRPGQTDEGELGLTYRELDAYIRSGQADAAVQQRVDSLQRASAHKRRLPRIPAFCPEGGSE